MLNHVGIDIFDRRFIFVPIHGDKHWSLMCIIRPNLIINNAIKKLKSKETITYSHEISIKLTENFIAEELEDADESEGSEGEQLPCILFMDSKIGCHKMSEFSKPLKS
jgi:Ulp1 family protease